MTFNRKYLEQACEEIDAAMFSGDSFLNEDNRKELQFYMARWLRALKAMATELDNVEDRIWSPDQIEEWLIEEAKHFANAYRSGLVTEENEPIDVPTRVWGERLREWLSENI